MKKWMVDCVLEAPSTCESILKNKDSLLKGLVEQFCSKDYKEIVLVASGSSYNIASCSKYAIQHYLKVKVELVHSVTYAKYDYQFHEGALVICMSQSGRSTNTIEAVERAKACGNDVIGLVMMPNSPLAEICKPTYLYGSDKAGQDVFVCRGVPSSTLFLILFALEAGLKKGVLSKEDYKRRMKDVENAVKLMPEVKKWADSFYEANKKDFVSMKRVMTAGIGAGLGVALEGALKAEETIGIPSNAYELEEFLHGPVYEAKKDHAIFLVDLDPISHERVTQIYKACHELTDRVYLITRYKGIKEDHVLHIDIDENCCSLLMPILFVIPFQMIASRVCDDARVSAITVYNYRFSQMVKTKA